MNNKPSLKQLRETIVNGTNKLFKVEKGSIETYIIDGKVTEITKDHLPSFTVGFKKPKKHWKPNYAKPFIDIMGFDEKNRKLILTDYEQGGYDLPGAWFTTHGDFFLTKEDAERFINGNY